MHKYGCKKDRFCAAWYNKGEFFYVFWSTQLFPKFSCRFCVPYCGKCYYFLRQNAPCVRRRGTLPRKLGLAPSHRTRIIADYPMSRRFSRTRTYCPSPVWGSFSAHEWLRSLYRLCFGKFCFKRSSLNLGSTSLCRYRPPPSQARKELFCNLFRNFEPVKKCSPPFRESNYTYCFRWNFGRFKSGRIAWSWFAPSKSTVFGSTKSSRYPITYAF